ncbi:AN1-type zinc finger protein 1 isoform X2 [Peromyscus leucopus]|uniref:AN1-type zinc finger protein 1 isoform X2 n=1 Tax=Peromyscus leucopus TaxID=10041 RepID=UPI001884FF39|nr:AN1-type zinc finger protein 1 isoform X2 [Peromyscus leucopus]
MAELDIGQHCQVQHCRQRGDAGSPVPGRGRPGPASDGRGGGGGLEHRSKDSHGCPEVNVIKERPKTDEHKSYPCSFKDCTEVELVAVICPYCEKNFCLRHRHQSDHGCEKLEIPKPRMAATQKLVKDIIETKAGGAVSKGRKGAKTSGTAAKVALMKLKMHADGDKSLPQTERIYFQVYLPKGSKEKSKAMFFCQRWSIGKVVDFAASLASLRNENNKSTAKKLRLCHVPSGEALPLDHTLETWITREDNPLYNGGNVILEYLNDEEQTLKNVDSYLE